MHGDNTDRIDKESELIPEECEKSLPFFGAHNAAMYVHE